MIKIIKRFLSRESNNTLTVQTSNNASKGRAKSTPKSNKKNQTNNGKEKQMLTNVDLSNKKSDRDIASTSLKPPLQIKHQEEGVVKIRPCLSPEGQYGLLGRIASTLSEGTEAHFEAIFMSLMTILSISIPKSRKCTPYGAKVTEHRLNFLLLAGTGDGKGISDDQTMSLVEVAQELAKKEASIDTLWAPVSSGGLASGEGIANYLRDSDTPNLDDKRLVIVEAEFQSVISKCNKTDSILSSTIRKLFDGKDLTSMTKSDPYTCRNPHVGIIGHITPSEYCSELSNSAISNGFANRFPIFSVFKKKGVPFPKVTDKEELVSLSKELNDVLMWALADEEDLKFAKCYEQLFTKVYDELRSLGPEGSIEQNLMARARHYVSMYSMMFAICDRSNDITEKHLQASLAWIKYWHSSVQYIFDTEKAAQVAANKETLAEHVLDVIKSLCKQNNTIHISKTPLSNALGRKCSGPQLSEALKILQERSTPAIRVTKGKHNRHTITLLG